MADLAHATESDTDLIGDNSAKHWAERFVARVAENPFIAHDEGAMLAWFASALATGGMAERARAADIITKACSCEWYLLVSCGKHPACDGADLALAEDAT